MGLRSTRVRTLERTIVTIPNSEFSNFQIENFARRDCIWYHPTLTVHYETTPDQIRYILVEARRMLYAHPKVDSASARIRFVGFGRASLDLEVFSYVTVTDYGEYLEVAEDLNLRLMDIVAAAGSSLVFPAQTTYVEQGRGRDPNRAQAAEAQVQEWRKQGELWLPRLPQQKSPRSRTRWNTRRTERPRARRPDREEARLTGAGLLALALVLSGCLGPVSLHEAVLGYDDTVSRLGREMLLVNIGRLRYGLPVHFTLATSIAATFEYQTNAAILGPVSDVGLNVGVSAAENPTVTIVPIQGKQFTERVLTPFEDTTFEFPVFQGVPIDMVMRLMADGIEVQTPEGTFARFILNFPTHPAEYEEFRRIAMHLAWLNATRRLFVGRLSFLATTQARLSTPPTATEVQQAFEKDFRWRPVAKDGVYALERRLTGRVVITNYDPRTLSDAERQGLNTRAGANPGNFVFVDIRPGHPGGDFPLCGALKLRSLNRILSFVAADDGGSSEYDVPKDPRTGDSGPNPRRALGIEVTAQAPPGMLPHARYGGRYYAVAETPWDLQAFSLLYQAFQMTVTDVSGVGVPITISK